MQQPDNPRQEASSATTTRGRVQFGIRSLMLIMLLVSVLAALAVGIVGRGSGKPNGLFVLACVAAPMGMMILLSIAEAATRLVAKHQARKSAKLEQSGSLWDDTAG